MTPPASAPSEASGPAHRVAVVGAGAVGGFYGGMLALAGVPVTLVARAAQVDAITRDGLAIVRADRRDVARVAATTEIPAIRSSDVVLVCVKSPDTREVANAIAPHLAPGATVVSLQNGVANADVLAEGLPGVVLASVVWVGVSMDAPGVVRHAGRGDLELGVARSGAGRPGASARAREIGAMFERAGVPCPVRDDIDAALWRKLITNCAFNAVSALGRARYGRMAAEPAVRGLMETVIGEAVAVARASGVEIDERSMIASVWNTAAAMSTQHSSTAQDIVRGKRTEIDMLNGFVADRGEALGVPVPVNRALHALVRLREAGDDLA